MSPINPDDKKAPRPLPSPEVQRDEGDLFGDEAEHATITGTYRVVKATALSTRMQWGAIGAVCLSIATGFGWSLNKMDVVNSASAQTQATANAALEASKANAARIEAVDAGTRQAVENLRREIADDRASTDRKLAEILRAVKAK